MIATWRRPISYRESGKRELGSRLSVALASARGATMIDLVIDQRRKDLGGFEVGRVLPYAKRRMVGPFVFFHPMGPVDMAPGIPPSVDVRPHPHIGLSTTPYLFPGAIKIRQASIQERVF